LIEYFFVEMLYEEIGNGGNGCWVHRSLCCAIRYYNHTFF
jgi:hypothetical protein